MYVAALSYRALVATARRVLENIYFEKNTVMTFDTEKLIREVESRKAIWDTSCDEYSDRDLKKKQWEEITNIICGENLSESEKSTLGKSLKQKWKNIRTSFSRELRRIAGAKSGSAASRKSPYIFFQQLQFLRETVINNVTEVSINEIDVVESHDEGENIRIRSPVTKKKKKNDDDRLIEVLKESISVREDRERDRESDSDRLFLLSLLKDFKKIPKERRLSTKIELMDVIKRAQITIETQGCSQDVLGSLDAGHSYRYRLPDIGIGRSHHGHLAQEKYGLGAYGPSASNSGQYWHGNSTQRNYISNSRESTGKKTRVYPTPISNTIQNLTIAYDEGLSSSDSSITTGTEHSEVFELFND